MKCPLRLMCWGLGPPLVASLSLLPSSLSLFPPVYHKVSSLLLYIRKIISFCPKEDRKTEKRE
jgi:hypothetical protein